MEIATFEHRARQFDPDLVIIDFVGNDLKLPHFLTEPRDLWTLERWYLRDLVAARWGAAARRPPGSPAASRSPGSAA